MFAAEDYAAPDGLDFAIQCRPRLVVRSVQHVKKDDGREAERTALCLRDGSTLEVVIAHGPVPGHGLTLSALSGLLVARGCQDALNLDGGLGALKQRLRESFKRPRAESNCRPTVYETAVCSITSAGYGPFWGRRWDARPSSCARTARRARPPSCALFAGGDVLSLGARGTRIR